MIFFFFLRQLQAGGGKAMSFGKSKAKMLNESDKNPWDKCNEFNDLES